ncbi:hypothetical protein PI124_g20877 [Phytophthora idaei]|nr:hypothetical protein PI124_g20877 [Phytophthora idaei]
MTETAHPVSRRKSPAKPPPLIQELTRRRSWSERRGDPQRVTGAGIEVERARRLWPVGGAERSVSPVVCGSRPVLTGSRR